MESYRIERWPDGEPSGKFMLGEYWVKENRAMIYLANSEAGIAALQDLAKSIVENLKGVQDGEDS